MRVSCHLGGPFAHQGESTCKQGEPFAHQGELLAYQGEPFAHLGGLFALLGELPAYQGELLAHQGEFPAHLGEPFAYLGELDIPMGEPPRLPGGWEPRVPYFSTWLFLGLTLSKAAHSPFTSRKAGSHSPRGPPTKQSRSPGLDSSFSVI